MFKQLHDSLTPFTENDGDNREIMKLALFYLGRAHEKFSLSTSSSKAFLEQHTKTTLHATVEKKLLYQKLKKIRKLTKYPVPVLLLGDLELGHPKIDAYNDLKAIGLVAMTWHLQTKRATQKLYNFCRGIHSISTPKGDCFLSCLPYQIYSLNQLIEFMDQASSTVPLGMNEKYKDLLNPLKALMNNRGANTITYLGSPFLTEAHPPHIQLHSFQGHNESIQLSIHPENLDQVYSQIHEEEQIYDQALHNLAITVNDKGTESNQKQQFERDFEAQNIASAFIKKDIKTKFDWDHLTEDEIGRIFTQEYQEAAKGSPKALLTCLSILTGRTNQKLKEIPINRSSNIYEGEQWHIANQRITLIYNLSLPKNNTKKNRTAYKPTHKDVHLPIPVSLSNLLMNHLNSGSFKDLQYQQHLSHLNDVFKNRLSEYKLADVLLRYLRFNDCHKPVIAALTGQIKEQCPGLFYSGIPRKLLNQKYQNFIEYLNRITGISYLKIHIPNDSPDIIGSNAIPHDDIIKNYFEVTNDQLKSAKNWHDFHNTYTFFTHQVLSLATGHRAVGSPFESITDFDTLTKQVIILDKDNRQTQSSRILHLSETAFQQFKNYTEHLKNSYYHHIILSSELAKEIKNSLKGEADFLFLSTKKLLVPVTPQYLSQYAEKLGLPNLKTNWHRHFMYSRLIQTNLSPYLVSNFFGHNSFGEEVDNPFSRSSIQFQRRIATEIEKIFSELKIQPVKGWSEK